MKFSKLSLLVFMLLSLPLAGVMLAGHDASTYLEFPPRTRYVAHAAFSWPVFIVLSIFILATVMPFIIRIGRARSPSAPPPAARTHTFPWWGWIALTLGAHCWILAWTRQTWFEPFQLYTFTPLWIAYIVVINALTYRRTGRCLLTHHTKYFLWLFPLSAAFWWFFEYLNRFVQNWFYIACADFSALQYFIAATLPFATVLPAVLSTEEWLATYPRVTAGLENFLPVRFKRPRPIAGTTLFISGGGLFFIGWFPDQLFPLLWVAPLLLLMAFPCLEPTIQPLEKSGSGFPGSGMFFPEIGNGDWRRVFRLCLAALICGFFWEMWNLHSLAKWIYTVPYISRFRLFEMPILGYSGYLPFGLECAVVADYFLGRRKEP